ncbi:isocitrate/isopropylmalate family dehydrogenase [Rhizobium sp. 007]|uniref:isocitrate/isopropylmalate family dehydrogenase n=1 Tax=Rhizobium sp. 007 TaxID=2785056 RepID=UPI00188EA996|nr:isocitrate/isopropylmalate family dehydrogenase [Rhizobium sp. 007]QPB24291.1 hypothetical protein ISN39_32495 [Rhizobium sp. 007]
MTRREKLKLLLLPGDGIGPDICETARSVIEFLTRSYDLGLIVETHLCGLAALEKSGSTFPPSTIEAALQADGIILGPLSTLEYPPENEGGVNASAWLRTHLGLSANIRPSKALVNCAGEAANIDLVIVRENTYRDGVFRPNTIG